MTPAMLSRMRKEQYHVGSITPLGKGVQHLAYPRDPPFQTSAETPAQHSVAHEFARWHPHPLLVAQAFSLIPESLSLPRVDWLALPQERTSRRIPPRNPWATRWSAEHLSTLIPPIGQESQAVDKLLRDQGQGAIFLRASADPTTLRRAGEAASYVLTAPPHEDNILSPTSSKGLSRGAALSIFIILPNSARTAPRRTWVTPVPPEWRTLFKPYHTPLRWLAWKAVLRFHPDKDLVDDVQTGMSWGRALGYTGQRLTGRACRNPAAHKTHAAILREIRTTEFSKAWRAGPFPAMSPNDGPPLFNLIANPTKPVFKRFGGGLPRHVVDLSSPHAGTSVNALIDRSHTRLHNARFEEVAIAAASLGRNTMMWKFDVVSAYKLVPIPLQDFHLQGEMEEIEGRTHYSFSIATSFGAKSSSDNFHDLAVALFFIILLLVVAIDACWHDTPTILWFSQPQPPTAELTLAKQKLQKRAPSQFAPRWACRSQNSRAQPLRLCSWARASTRKKASLSFPQFGLRQPSMSCRPGFADRRRKWEKF